MKHWLESELYQQLRKDSQLFEYLRTSTMDGLWYWDLENPQHEWMDDRFWLTLGYDPETKQGVASEHMALALKEDLDAANDMLQQHLQDPMHEYDQVIRYYHKNGSVVWIRCRGVVIRNDAGKPVRMIGTHTNITNTINLSEQQALLASSTKASPVGHLIEDNQGNILEANDAVADWLGYTTDDLRFMNVMDLVPDLEKARTGQLLDDLKSSTIPEITSLKKQYKHRDGRLLWGHLSARSVKDSQGNVRYIVASILDIQNEMELEEKLRQKNLKLSLANKELDQFAYIASHDLKSPLTGIRRLADWIAEDCQEILPEASKRHLRLLDDRVQRMERLLDDLLAYSRLGSQRYEVSEVNLASSVKQITEVLEGADNITVNAPAHRFMIQRVPFEMVIRNLIDNAIKHNPKKQSTITVSVTQMDDEYEFILEDDGPGIEPEYQEKIFEMFKRLNSKDEVDGSGMGLAIVKKNIESYGGHIKVVSDGIRGTKVVIRWPIPTNFEAP